MLPHGKAIRAITALIAVALTPPLVEQLHFFDVKSITTLSLIQSAQADEDGSSAIIADAGFDQHVSIGQAVQLDASRSGNLSGGPVNYRWTLVQKPAGSRVSLSGASALLPRPNFTVDVSGDYIFNLAVNSNGGVDDNHSAGAQVTVSTGKVRPVADAGLNRLAPVGSTIGLDGARSFDADGSAISYSWTLVQKPYGSKSALSNPKTVRPSLKLDQPGSYVAELIVTAANGLVSPPARVGLSTRESLAGRASAGPAQAIARGATARIDADGTYLPSGAPTLATWSLISAPAGSKAALRLANDARQTLQPDVAGDYVVQMLIGGAADCGDSDDFDDLRQSSQRFARFATVLVSTGNVPPRAVAGPDQLIAAGSLVSLDGSRSTDVNGDLLTYTWALISRPAGSVAALDNPNAVRPKFTADIAGTYVAELIVFDGRAASKPSTVTASTLSAAPIANAGPDVLAKTGTAIALDGSQSNDPMGGVLRPSWSILGLGDQSTGSLSAPAALLTNFNVPVAGVPLVQAVLAGPAALPISYGDGDNDSDDNGGALSLISSGRLSSAGLSYTIWDIHNPSRSAATVTLASVAAGFNRSFSVPAQSDFFVASSVTAGSAPHRLLVSGKTIATVNAVATTFSDNRLVGGGPALELSIVQLAVANTPFQSVDDVVVSTVEARPVAIPGASQISYRGVPLTLDASKSLNPNQPATPGAGLTYRWALLSRPAGSAANLVNASSALPALTPDVYGLYVAQLIVSDGVLDSRPSTIAIQIVPRPPVASASAVSPVPVGQAETLNGSASFDPDGNPLIYAWTLASAPTGSAAVLSNPTAALSSFKPDLPGTYTAQLVVSDAYGVSTPAIVTITAQSSFAFTPIGPQSVALGSSLQLNISAIDSKSRPVTYAPVGALPSGAMFNAATGAFFFRPTSNSPSAYSFTFTATNGVDVASLTLPVSVTGAPTGSTALNVQIYDAVDYAAGKLTPVSGALAKVGSVAATTAANGSTSLTGIPAGSDTVIVSAANAALAPDGSTYADTAIAASIIAGVTNTLNAPILLARNSGAGTAINGGGATIVANTTLGVTVTIAQNSAFNADGTPFTGHVALGSLPANTPVNLPPGYAPCQLFTLSPVGVTFNPPAQITVANSDKLPAGAQVDLWAFDPQFGNFRIVGVGQVSSDGQSVALQVGGIPSGAVFAFAPRRPAIAPVATQPTDIFAPNLLGGGDMASSYSPPGARQLNNGRGLTFVYHSSTANPQPVIDQNTVLSANNGLPGTLTTRLALAGDTQSTTLSTNLSTPLRAATPALNATVNNSILQAGQINAKTLPTGRYPYSFLTVSKFACSAVGSQSVGSVVINNQSQSAFGSGWQLAEVQKLNLQADGGAVIAEGNGRAVAIYPEQAPSFLPNPVYIPVAGPFRGAVADLQSPGSKDLLKLGWKDASFNVILNKGNRQFYKASALTVGAPGVHNPDGSLAIDATDIIASDMDNDGNVDAIVMQKSSSLLNFYFGASGGGFQLPFQANYNGDGRNVVAGDWQGDGARYLMLNENGGDLPDIHVVYPLGSQRVYATNSFNAGALPGGIGMGLQSVRLPGFAHDSVVGVTQGGFVFFDYGGADNNTVWRRGPGPLNLGGLGLINTYVNDQTVSDSLQLPSIAPATSVGRVFASADIDYTGAPSFAVAGLNQVHIVKWLDPGANNQTVTQTLQMPAGVQPDSVTLAPLAAGNRPSLIVTAGVAGFYVFTNNDQGGFNPTPSFIQTPFRVGLDAHVVDFDGDGVADIALNDLDNDRVAIFFGAPHPDGNFVAPIGDYTRLVQNPDGSYSRLYNDGTSVTFNAAGFQTAIADANGNQTLYTYNAQGQLTQIVDPTGAITTMTYSGAFLASLTDGAGRTTSFVHDAAGDLTQITDPAGAVTQYIYDANHNLTVTIDPNNNSTTSAYTATGQLSKQTYPDGTSVSLDVSQSLGLDALGVSLGGPTNAAFVPAEARVSLLQDSNGNLSETEVNQWGAVVRVTDALGRVSTFVRDDANRVVAANIPAGAVSGPGSPTVNGLPQIVPTDTLTNLYTYDASGNILTMEEAAGHGADNAVYGTPVDRTTHYVYEPTHNKLIKKTDPAGFVTTWTYDSRGNMLAMTNAAGAVTSYTYNAQGLPLAKTDANGNVTTYAYDANGNLTRTKDAAGTFFDRYYDAPGNVILTSDATGTSYERHRASRYDANNRVTQQTSATGQITRMAYDPNGNVIEIIDAANNITQRAWDGLNRLRQETTPDSGTTAWNYDGNGNTVNVTDASGAVTSYVYDAANRATAVTDALGASKSFVYDLRDNLTAFTNTRGNTTRFNYDVLKRKVIRFRPDGVQEFWIRDLRDNVTTYNSGYIGTNSTFDALSRLVGFNGQVYSYDANNNLVSSTATDDSIAYTYRYDALNRLTSRAAQRNYSTAFGGGNTLTQSWAYDPLSRRASMSDSVGGTTGYAFDAEDRLTQITTPWNAVITQSYDAAGRPLRLSYPNGLDADLSFETATGRLASINHRAGSLAAPLASFNHSYDIRGNLAQLAEITNTKTFAYDKVEQLTGVQQTVPAPAASVESYAYDPDGNPHFDLARSGQARSALPRISPPPPSPLMSTTASPTMA